MENIHFKPNLNMLYFIIKLGGIILSENKSKTCPILNRLQTKKLRITKYKSSTIGTNTRNTVI